MRQIKFRVWNKGTARFLENSSSLHCYSQWVIDIFTGKVIDCVGTIDGDHTKDEQRTLNFDKGYFIKNLTIIKESPYVIQQFTGLFDKNKRVEVYEGDLVKITSDCEGREPRSPTDKETSPAMEVYWNNEWNGFRVRFVPSYNKNIYEEHSLPTFYQALKELEIVGNIFEK